MAHGASTLTVLITVDEKQVPDSVYSLHSREHYGKDFKLNLFCSLNIHLLNINCMQTQHVSPCQLLYVPVCMCTVCVCANSMGTARE